MVGILSTMNIMNNILIPRTRNVPSSILPKFDCYNRVSLNSLANENLYLTCFSINSGLTHTNICGCIQLLNDIWYSVLPGSNDCMVHTNKLELVSMWHTSDSDGAYSRVPYYYDSGILLEFNSGVFSDPQFLSIILPGNSLFSCPGIRLHLSCIQ